MKNRILILTALLIALGVIVQGQNNPFASKAKSTTSAGFMPEPVKQISGLNATGTARMQSVPSFHPVSHPLPPLSRHAGSFTEKHVNPHGQVIFLSGGPSPDEQEMKKAGNPSEACLSYLDAIRSELRVDDPRSEFTFLSDRTDELGIRHVKMQQVIEGIPVYCGEIYLHLKTGRPVVFNGNPYPTPDLPDLVPAVSRHDAQMTAESDLSNRTTFTILSDNERKILRYEQPACELVIYHKDRDPGQEHLAYHFTVRPNFVERWEYFIDAKTGAVLHYYYNTQTDGDVTATGPDLNGVNRTVHCYLQGSSYLMVDVSRPMFNTQNQEGIIAVYDANYTCPFVQGFSPGLATSSNNTWSPKAISAQYHTAVTYEHHRVTNNKNSWNDKGGSLFSVINATTENGGGLDNAFWNGICLIYGNGDVYFKPLQGAMDVVAHEIGHAYDEGSANLEYQNQSGALNEAYADIAAAVVERLNWQCGEDIVKPGFFPGGCLRDMSNPHNGGTSLSDPGYQPAHVSEMYTGTDDNGGVHINNGIINFTFYKFVTAAGMNMDKGERVFLRALFNYLTRSSQFIDCRLAVIQSAKDLYGDGSAEVNAVKSAFDQVGIADGSGGNYENDLQVNPGQDYILAYNTYAGDPNTLYISNTTATNFTPITQTALVNKPSIVDNGSVAVFIGADKKMHAITLGPQYQESIIQNDAVWSNVAISKDGTLLAAVTDYQDSTIYIYSFQKQQWIMAHLYNPTTQEGIVTNNVLFADALEWDYSGEYIMYDAFNQMNSSTSGQSIDYWDISFMHVWDRASSDWGTGKVFKMVSGIPEGVSIGNPSFSKNSPYVCAFDYYEASSNAVSVLAANLETGEFVEVFGNGTVLSYPNYSKIDDKILFTSVYNSSPVLATIGMSSDKIHPASTTATAIINEAKWGVWYAQGNRPLGEEEAVTDQQEMRIYPNPASDRVTIVFGDIPAEPFTVGIYNSQGRLVRTLENAPSESITVDLSGIAPGLYLLKVTGKDFTAGKKLVVR